MSQTFTGKRTTIHFNGDFSGKVLIVNKNGKELKVCGEDLQQFALMLFKDTIEAAFERTMEDIEHQILKP